MALPTADTAPSANGTRDPLAALRTELDGYLRSIQRFSKMEPDQVLIELSALGARLTEIKVHLSRSENRMATSFREKELNPLLDQLDFQFRVHSRLQAIRELDARFAGGAPS